MNIAVIFFGIARSMHLSVESIRQMIYAANEDVELTVIASLNLAEEVHNPRNDEFAAPLDSRDCFELGAEVYVLRAQQERNVAPYLELARQQRDAFDNNWISTRNMLHQLHSLRAGWIAATHLTDRVFDAYLFVRPDQIYLDPIRIGTLLERFHGTRNILLPDWHSWGGFNDRVALADPLAARCYADRLSLVAEYCRSRPLHAEQLLAYAMARGHCRVGRLPVRAQRLRASGTVFDEDFTQALIPIPERPGAVELWSDALSGVTIHEIPPGSRLRFDLPAMAALPEAVPDTAAMAAPAVFSPRLERVTVDGHLRVTPLMGRHYIDTLKQIHYARRIQRYLEIGVNDGGSLALARGRAIGIDPSPVLPDGFLGGRSQVSVVAMTSDDYFAAHDPRVTLDGSIEMAFIDGLHQADAVLRDFINVEQACSPDSIILIHDVLPQNHEMTEREHRRLDRKDEALSWNWTGDVWRVLPILRAMRPDLTVRVLDCPPTGLAVVTNLNPVSRLLAINESELSRTLREEIPTEAQFWSFIDHLTLEDSSSVAL